jgi:menaquinol-cytochrome c reductase cytochrome b/c subunit
VSASTGGPAAGRLLVGQSGCLACHRIGENGNNGPGPNLSDVGARLSAARIRHALVDPTAPMPSFKELPARSLRALVAYLHQL